MRHAAILVSALLLAASASAETPASWDAALKQADSLVKQRIEKGGVPSYSIAIVSRNHPTHFISAGYADTSRKIPASAATAYEIGSVTKVFTGTMLMQMREAGLANLDDPLTKHVPEFAMPSPFTGKTSPTIRQIVSHTAGLPRMIPLNSLQEPSAATPDEMLKSLSRTDAVYPPLTRYKYSNLGIDLLGYGLAHTAKMPWPDYIDQKILKPLGMTHSSAAKQRLAKDTLATGYIPAGPSGGWQAGPPAQFATLTEASGSIVSTATDMAKFVAWQMDETDGRVLTPVSRREMRSPLWVVDEWNAGVAVTWFLQRLEGETLVHHTGGTAGFGAVAAFIPKQGIGIVALTNSTDDVHGFARELLKPLLAAAKAERPQPAPVALPAGAEKLAGLYLHGKGLLPPYMVRIDNGALVMESPLFGRARLIPTANPASFTATDNEGVDGENVTFEDSRLIVGHGAMVFVRP